MFSKVYEAFLAYQLILFHDVDLPPATQVAFARDFGEVQIHVLSRYHGSRSTRNVRAVRPRPGRQPETASIPTKARCSGTPTAPGANAPGKRP